MGNINSDIRCSWTLSDAPASNWTSIAMSANGSLQLAIDGKDLYNSFNYGHNWTLHNSMSSSYVGGSFVKMSADAQYQYILKDTGGYWRSEDSGESFAFVDDSIQHTDISISKNGSNWIMAGPVKTTVSMDFGQSTVDHEEFGEMTSSMILYGEDHTVMVCEKYNNCFLSYDYGSTFLPITLDNQDSSQITMLSSSPMTVGAKFGSKVYLLETLNEFPEGSWDLPVFFISTYNSFSMANGSGFSDHNNSTTVFTTDEGIYISWDDNEYFSDITKSIFPQGKWGAVVVADGGRLLTLIEEPPSRGGQANGKVYVASCYESTSTSTATSCPTSLLEPNISGKYVIYNICVMVIVVVVV